MKNLKSMLGAVLLVSFAAGPFVGLAEDKATDKATDKTKAKPYPLKTCIISGEKLGEMGAPFVYVHEGHEIKFCCKGCLKDFKKDPAKYVKKIDEAAAKESKDKTNKKS